MPGWTDEDRLLSVRERASARRFSSISEAVKRRVKRVVSRLGEDPRDKARAVVEGGLGLGYPRTHIITDARIV